MIWAIGVSMMLLAALVRLPLMVIAAFGLVLYPACRWFAAVKRRRNDRWLAYL